MKTRLLLLTVLSLVPALAGTACNGFLFGTPGPQDGGWTATTPPPGILGSSTFTVRISLDRITELTVNGLDWGLQQSFPATRTNDHVSWTVWATPPAGQTGPIPGTPFISYTFDVVPQTDGTLSGTVAESGAGVVPVFGSPFNISMTRF
jgi:hypothetical protein